MAWATDKQVGFIYVLSKRTGREVVGDPSRLTQADASKLIKQLLSSSLRPGQGVSRRAERLGRYLRG